MHADFRKFKVTISTFTFPPSIISRYLRCSFCASPNLCVSEKKNIFQASFADTKGSFRHWNIFSPARMSTRRVCRKYGESVIWARLHALSRWNVDVIFRALFFSYSHHNFHYKTLLLDVALAGSVVEFQRNCTTKVLSFHLQMALTMAACFHWRPY